MARAAAALVLLAALCNPALAQGNGELAGLINDFRAAPHACDGEAAAMAGPLTPTPALANAAPVEGGKLNETLKAAGYAASRSLAITLTGPGDAASAMELLRKHYCKQLSSARYSEIGIRREGRHWRIVLAQPVLSPGLGSSREAGKRILQLVNDARATARQCGTRRFDAVPPLAWNAKLAQAALAHSSDMARQDYFAHAAPDGGRVGERAKDEGYAWRAIGENIAAGQGAPKQVMAGWLSSPGHCANIMSDAYSEMGAAYAVDRASTATIYWTQVFGAR